MVYNDLSSMSVTLRYECNQNGLEAEASLMCDEKRLQHHIVPDVEDFLQIFLWRGLEV